LIGSFYVDTGPRIHCKPLVNHLIFSGLYPQPRADRLGAASTDHRSLSFSGFW